MVKLDAKTPAEILDYQVNFTPELTAESDTISSISWIVDNTLTKVTETNTATTGTVWLKGGIVGQLPQIKATVITAAGRKYERSALIPIVKDLPQG